MGVAASHGAALTPGRGLWTRLARLYTRRDAAAREDAERLLLEADFGVAATAAILDRLAQVPEAELEPALERAIHELLAAPPGSDPGVLVRAAVPPTVILVFGVNGSGKTTTIAKLTRRLERGGRP